MASIADAPTTHRLFTWGRASLALVLFLVSGGIAFALTNLTDLGKPTNSVAASPVFRLSGFHRIGTSLTHDFRPEVLMIGTQLGQDNFSAIERWPLVKALDQFGTFSGMKVAQQVCRDTKAGSACSDATYDWTHATYRSRYVTFIHKDLATSLDKPLDRLSRVELSLYNRYVRIRSSGSDPYDANNTANYALGRESTRGFPLVLVRNYLQTRSQIVTTGDFEQTLMGPPINGNPNFVNYYEYQSGYPFATIQRALRDGSFKPNPSLVPDVNAEANIITALICHADGKQPGRVCGRSVIRHLLPHVR